jgi:hypothetical protein
MLTNIRQRVLSLLDVAAMPRVPVLTLSITDPSLLTLTPTVDVVVMRGANIATPLRSASERVQSVILSAGPLADGTTANTSVVFIGGAGVRAAAGFPLAPGQTISSPPCDLADIWVISATATDTVRFLYYA